MATEAVAEARREAQGEAILFVVVAAVLLIALAATSLAAGWELIGLQGWVWLVLCVPEAVLIGALFLSSEMGDDERHHRWLQVFIAFVVVGNLCGLLVLVAALLTEKTSELTGAQLLMSGLVVWLTNVIVFGLWFWTLDCGGPVRRAHAGRRRARFSVPSGREPIARPDGLVPPPRRLRLRCVDEWDRVQPHGCDAADSLGQDPDGPRGDDLGGCRLARRRTRSQHPRFLGCRSRHVSNGHLVTGETPSTRPADAQLIVIESSFSLKAPRSSVTRTVNVNVPAVVGVPEMVFSRLGSSRPGGSAPATSVQA